MGDSVVAQNPSPDKVVVATSEVVRLLLKEGARLPHFQRLIDQPAKRAELIRWLESGDAFGKQKWQVNADGTITLTVTSDGTTGPDWITKLRSAGKRLSEFGEYVLRSDKFRATTSVIYRVTILPGELFSDAERIIKKIRLEAVRRGLLTPHPEIACLLRMLLSDEEIEQLGLWWLVVMHESIENSVGSPRLLGIGRGVGGRRLDAFWGDPDGRQNRNGGFAFMAPAS